MKQNIRADEIDAFRRSLEFNVVDAFKVKQQTLKKLKKVFKGEDIQTRYSVLS